MNIYKDMYLKLFNEVTDTIERLKELQKECERMYIEAQED